MNTIAVFWFFTAPLLFVSYGMILGPRSPTSLDWWAVGCYLLGALCWFWAAHRTYGRFFTILEARWPRAKIVRQILNVIWAAIASGSMTGHSS